MNENSPKPSSPAAEKTIEDGPVLPIEETSRVRKRTRPQRSAVITGSAKGYTEDSEDLHDKLLKMENGITPVEKKETKPIPAIILESEITSEDDGAE